MSFYTLAVSGADRVHAVHENFAGRSNTDLLQVLYYVLIAIVAVFFVLALANYLQQRNERNKQAAHRAQMDAKLARAARSRVRY